MENAHAEPPTPQELDSSPDLSSNTDSSPFLPQANVMLSYPIPEAEELLTNKLSAAQQSLRNCEEDLDFLREQVTVRCDFERDFEAPSPFCPLQTRRREFLL